MNKASSGFGLVEVIVALTIFSTSLLGLAAVTAVAHNALTNAARTEEGTRVAAAVLDSLMSERDPVDGSRPTGRVPVAWTVRGDSITLLVEVRSAMPDRPAQVLTFTAVHHAN